MSEPRDRSASEPKRNPTATERDEKVTLYGADPEEALVPPRRNTVNVGHAATLAS